MKLWQVVFKHLGLLTEKITNRLKLNSLKGFTSLFLVGISLSVAIAACSSGDQNNSTNGGSAANKSASPVAANKQDVELTLVSFAVTKAAHEAIIPKFVDNWKKEHNQNLTFKQSYGRSGSQTRAVIDGLEADVVHLSLAGDTQKIEKAELIQPGWEKTVPNNAIVSKTVAGNIANKTQSLPLFVEEAYKQYETEAAYSAAVLLALLAVVTLVLKEILERKTGKKI